MEDFLDAVQNRVRRGSEEPIDVLTRTVEAAGFAMAGDIYAGEPVERGPSATQRAAASLKGMASSAASMASQAFYRPRVA